MLHDAIWQVQLTADPAMSGRTELVVDLNEQVTLTFLAATEGDMELEQSIFHFMIVIDT